MLRVANISVFYDAIRALWDVSFQVDEGEVVTIVGANGAGKTTTLKGVAGVIPIVAGEVYFAGRPIHRLPAHEIVARGLSLIPEGRKLFPEMTVVENLLMGAYSAQARADRKEALKRVYRLFPLLEERKGQLARTLSGGEQQMLAIGRGLMSRPRLLMLDEPSLGLAPLLVTEVFRVINEINRQGTTVLLVEQNIRHALEACHRAYVLESGRITLEGKGQELLANEHVKKSYLGI